MYVYIKTMATQKTFHNSLAQLDSFLTNTKTNTFRNVLIHRILVVFSSFLLTCFLRSHIFFVAFTLYFLIFHSTFVGYFFVSSFILISVCLICSLHLLFQNFTDFPFVDFLLLNSFIYPTHFISFTLIPHFYTTFSVFLSLFFFLFFLCLFLYLLQMSVLSIPIYILILLLRNYFFSTQFIYHFNLFFF